MASSFQFRNVNTYVVEPEGEPIQSLPSKSSLDFSPQSSCIEEAPDDGKQYVRQNESWQEPDKENILGIKITDSPEFADTQIQGLKSDANGGSVPDADYNWFKGIYATLVDGSVKSFIKGLLSVVNGIYTDNSIKDSGTKYRMVAGVLRNVNGTWIFLTSNGHNKLNIASVEQTTTYIRVNFGFTVKNVVSFVATPDEEFVKQGYQFGASVSLTSADITIGQNVCRSGYITWNGTSWVVNSQGSSISATFSNGVLTINHQYVNGLSGHVNVREGLYLASIYSLGYTSTGVILKDYDGNTVTAPAVNTRIIFSRSADPMIPIEPSSINYSGANIWVIGIFEVD